MCRASCPTCLTRASSRWPWRPRSRLGRCRASCRICGGTSSVCGTGPSGSWRGIMRILGRLGIIDESGNPKKGPHTAGVQRQWCGNTGKRDNCVVGVHLGYVAGDFQCLLDSDLYLPQDWVQDPVRRQEAGIPEEVVFRTKPALALEQIGRAVRNGIRVSAWTFDEFYGRGREFLDGLQELGRTSWARFRVISPVGFRSLGSCSIRVPARDTREAPHVAIVAYRARVFPPVRCGIWSPIRRSFAGRSGSRCGSKTGRKVPSYGKSSTRGSTAARVPTVCRAQPTPCSWLATCSILRRSSTSCPTCR